MRNVLLPLLMFLGLVANPLLIPLPALAQDGQPKVTQGDIEQILASNQPAPTPQAKKSGLGGMNFLQLLIDGGMLMIPIGIMSLLVLAIGFERWVALRSGKVFPRRLKREIRRAIDNEAPLTPVELYRAAELVPSSAAKVLIDMLSKVGRPIAEVESEISESVQREADRLYGNVRWLTLAAAVTPLIGLLGTVWGLILAFFNTTQLTNGSNRVESLAEGIYIALVTTLGGLAVAIPAAILAHFFEGKITRMLGAVDAELRRLTPWLEQYEGKVRFDIGPRGITSRSVQSGAQTIGAQSNGSQTNTVQSNSPQPPLAAPPIVDGTASHGSLRPPKMKA